MTTKPKKSADPVLILDAKLSQTIVVAIEAIDSAQGAVTKTIMSCLYDRFTAFPNARFEPFTKHVKAALERDKNLKSSTYANYIGMLGAVTKGLDHKYVIGTVISKDTIVAPKTHIWKNDKGEWASLQREQKNALAYGRVKGYLEAAKQRTPRTSETNTGENGKPVVKASVSLPVATSLASECTSIVHVLGSLINHVQAGWAKDGRAVSIAQKLDAVRAQIKALYDEMTADIGKAEPKAEPKLGDDLDILLSSPPPVIATKRIPQGRGRVAN